MLKLVQRFWAAGRAYWETVSNPQRLLFISGSLVCLSMIVHSLILVVSGSSFHGPVSLRKAITFAETLWLTSWAVAWLLPFFRLGRIASWALAVVVSLFATAETFLMSMQVWRGVPSHYNFTTVFDMTVYLSTGVGALGFTIVVGILLALSFRLRGLPLSLRTAIVGGLVLTFYGALIGILMSANSGPVWQGLESLVARQMAGGFGQYNGQPEGSVGGNLVLIHALGVHGLQVLPLIPWLLGYTALNERQRLNLSRLNIVGWFGLTIAASVQAFRMLPITALDPLTGLVMIASSALILAVTLATGWITYRSLRGRSAQTAYA
jgi:hypothetical protein